VNSWKFLHGSGHDVLSLYGHCGTWSQGLSGGYRRIELTCIKKKQNFRLIKDLTLVAVRST
jgi:hypothetical protein